LPNISNQDYHREAGPSVITTTAGVNLTKFNLVVSTVLKAAICLTCQRPVVPPDSIPRHVHEHVSQFQLGEEDVETLTQRFSLGSTVQYPPHPIDPIFGIPLLEEPHFFCDKCQCGFIHLTGIQTHQSSDRCTGATYHKGYGQSISGTNRRIIEVHIDKLKRKSDITVDYDTWFQSGITPARDYSKLPVPIAEDRSNMSSFFYSDGWLEHIKGHTPEQLFDARRPHENDDKHGVTLRQAAHRYLFKIQPDIQDHILFGLLKDIGSMHE